MSQQGRKINWGFEETENLLKIIRDQNTLQKLDGKKYRHITIFKSVEEDMKKLGYNRSAEQIRAKLKSLKREYIEVKKKNNSKSGAARQECLFYDLLDSIFNDRPIIIDENSGVESGRPSVEANKNGTEEKAENSPIPKRRRTAIQKQYVEAEMEILKRSQEWWKEEFEKQRQFERELLDDFKTTLQETMRMFVQPQRMCHSSGSSSSGCSSRQIKDYVSSFKPDSDSD